MKISLQNVGKRFNREWIFRHCSYEFLPGKNYAVTGPNGSGKSTLLQVIAGATLHNEGTVEYRSDTGYRIQETGSGIQDSEKYSVSTSERHSGAGNILHPVSSIQHPVSVDRSYQLISIAAPYLELIEEMTALEMLAFHSKFKPLIPALQIEDMLQVVGLENAVNKQIRYFSSGMKQRLKLAQAFFSNTPVLLLDEPTTNLDADGIALYHNLVSNYTKEKLVIVSSNVKQEYDFCEEMIGIEKYK